MRSCTRFPSGMIFPGGLTDLWMDSPYVVAARKLWQWAKEANDGGAWARWWGCTRWCGGWVGERGRQGGSKPAAGTTRAPLCVSCSAAPRMPRMPHARAPCAPPSAVQATCSPSTAPALVSSCCTSWRPTSASRSCWWTQTRVGLGRGGGRGSGGGSGNGGVVGSGGVVGGSGSWRLGVRNQRACPRARLTLLGGPSPTARSTCTRPRPSLPALLCSGPPLHPGLL